jgi:hypothetical protein
LAERLVAHHQTARDAEAIADFGEGTLLTGLSALSVGYVQGCNMGCAPVTDGKGGTNGRVHASRESNYGLD